MTTRGEPGGYRAGPMDHYHGDSCRTCQFCGGTGADVIPGHGCHGDTSLCRKLCPVPVEYACSECGGIGCYPIEDEGDPFP